MTYELSKAPQSGEPASALDQKRISTKNQCKIVGKIKVNLVLKN